MRFGDSKGLTVMKAAVSVMTLWRFMIRNREGSYVKKRLKRIKLMIFFHLFFTAFFINHVFYKQLGGFGKPARRLTWRATKPVLNSCCSVWLLMSCSGRVCCSHLISGRVAGAWLNFTKNARTCCKIAKCSALIITSKLLASCWAIAGVQIVWSHKCPSGSN